MGRVAAFLLLAAAAGAQDEDPRIARSRRMGVGETEDRLVSVRCDELSPYARYALLVPDSYDPREPWPLVVVLHGGRPGGLREDRVAGEGGAALGLYRDEARRRGYLVAAPTAAVPGWHRRENDAIVDAVLDEVCALYHVDLARVYLAGHSMGGAGAWAQGARRPELWAAVAATASYDVQGLAKLARTRTGVYVYHGARDERTPVEPVREALAPWLDRMDLAYREAPEAGHELPPAVVAEMFDFFAPRRRSVLRGLTYETTRDSMSSFAAPPDPAIERYLPPLHAPAGPRPVEALWADLEAGGGLAARAVAELVSRDEPRIDAAAARLLRADRPDVRAAAARLLEMREAAGQRPALERALDSTDDARAVVAILDALAATGGVELAAFFRRRAAFVRRHVRAGAIDYADWVDGLAPLVRACALAGPRARDALEREVVDGLLLADPEVLHDPRFEDPDAPALLVARAAARALGRLKDPASRPCLERLLDSRWARDPAIAAEAAAALVSIR